MLSHTNVCCHALRYRFAGRPSLEGRRGTSTKEAIMRVQPKKIAYTAVGAAEIAAEKLRDAAEEFLKAAKKARRGTERAMATAEKRGRASAPRTRGKAKRVAARTAGRAKRVAAARKPRTAGTRTRKTTKRARTGR
jgi:hypothetical protein